MRKTKSNEGESRRIGPVPSLWPILLGAGLAFGLVFLLLLGAAALFWSGTLPFGGALPPAVCAGLAALAGGRLAVRTGEGGPLSAGLLSAALFCGGLLALCFLYGGGVRPSRQLFSLLLMALAGGGLAGLLGRRKGKKRPGKR